MFSVACIHEDARYLNCGFSLALYCYLDYFTMKIRCCIQRTCQSQPYRCRHVHWPVL